MSNISARLVPDPQEGVKLNAYIFAVSLMAHLEDVLTASEALQLVNNHILNNTGTVLTAAEIIDVGTMKGHYNGLNQVDKAKYRDLLISLAQLLQDTEGVVPFTEAKWDLAMGLST